MFTASRRSTFGRISERRCQRPAARAFWWALISALVYLVGVIGPQSSCRADTFTSLYSFMENTAGNTDGAIPEAGLIQASDGNLYGTTKVGGTNHAGTVFKITTGGALTSLHSFDWTDGALPDTNLIQASDGNLYGTIQDDTSDAGSTNGTIYRITTGGVLTTLYTFDTSASPSNLIQASDGNLYGTDAFNGGNGTGRIFKVTTDGVLTTLYSFSALGTSDGVNPAGGLIQGKDGNLYGTAVSGGAYGVGTVFKITIGGAFTILHSFNRTDGANTYAGLIQASDGNLYGTTPNGGANGDGTIFKITTGGTFTTLYSFSGGTSGSSPEAGLIQAGNGDLYGTAGPIFKITTGGTFTTVHSFNGTDGSGLSFLTQASDGNLYGTTSTGGTNNGGTVFRLSVSPKMASLSPASVKANTSFTLTVNGLGFVSGDVVGWNGQALFTQFVSAHRLTATVPVTVNVPLLTYPAKAAISVTNLYGDKDSKTATRTARISLLPFRVPS